MSTLSYEDSRGTSRVEQHEDLLAGASVSLILGGVILLGLISMVITVLWTL
jgi:hypothetical protein